MSDRSPPAVNEAAMSRELRWRRYLAAFHNARPAITERLLDKADFSPYAWLVEPLRDVAGPVLDVACGSAPTRPLLPTSRWLGIDSSAGELGFAAAAGRGPLVRASADALPLADASVAGISAAMCLPVVSPLDRVLGELLRVLRPGGVLSALVPARLGFHATGLYHWFRIMTAVGVARQPWPNPEARDGLPRVLRRHGFRIRSSERRIFLLTLSSDADAALLLDALYLPTVVEPRMHAARRSLARWIHGGVQLALPLRRVIAEAPGDSEPRH